MPSKAFSLLHLPTAVPAAADPGEQTVSAGSTLGDATGSLSQAFEAEAGRSRGIFRSLGKKCCVTDNLSRSSVWNPRATGGGGGGAGADGAVRSETWAATTTEVEDISRRVHPLGGRERFTRRRGKAGELASGRCLRGEPHHVQCPQRNSVFHVVRSDVGGLSAGVVGKGAAVHFPG